MDLAKYANQYIFFKFFKSFKNFLTCFFSYRFTSEILEVAYSQGCQTIFTRKAKHRQKEPKNNHIFTEIGKKLAFSVQTMQMQILLPICKPVYRKKRVVE